MENYFWNTEETENIRQLYVLIIYDIVDNKRRNHFAREMNGYGFRVQKSAFEAMIPEHLFKKLLKKIPELIDVQIDNVRVYKIRGHGEVVLYGATSQIESEELIIL